MIRCDIFLSRKKYCILKKILFIKLFFCFSTQLHAETQLSRVLKLINTTPISLLKFDQLFINSTYNLKEESILPVSNEIDSSINFYVGTPTNENDEFEFSNNDKKNFEIDFTTNAIGTTNTGIIELTINTEPKDGTNILAVNSASGSGMLSAAVKITTNNDTLDHTGKVSTSAIGNINTGSIDIVINNSSPSK